MEAKEHHFDWSDQEFIIAFEQCSFPAELFNHEAHLRLAWIYIQKMGVDRAISTVCEQLLHYVNHWGAQEKYHATVTVAGVELVHYFLQKNNVPTFKTFLLEFPLVKTAFRTLINSHYKEDIFVSTAAKNTYLAPDLQAFREKIA